MTTRRECYVTAVNEALDEAKPKLRDMLRSAHLLPSSAWNQRPDHGGTGQARGRFEKMSSGSDTQHLLDLLQAHGEQFLANFNTFTRPTKKQKIHHHSKEPPASTSSVAENEEDVSEGEWGGLGGGGSERDDSLEHCAYALEQYPGHLGAHWEDSADKDDDFRADTFGVSADLQPPVIVFDDQAGKSERMNRKELGKKFMVGGQHQFLCLVED
jgi:hypothetical protein